MLFKIIKNLIIFVFFADVCAEKPTLLPRVDEKSHSQSQKYIIGGEPAFLGEFPGMLSLQLLSGKHHCGGTLINANHVLTAAHCFKNGNNGLLTDAKRFLLMGDSLLRFPNATSQIRKVAQPFTPTKTFFPVSLSTSTPPPNLICSVAGWGTTDFYGPVSVNLLRVDVTVISTDYCNSSESYNGVIQKHTLCAGSLAGGKDSCQGDSGGGLICNSLLAGVVSYGNKCGLRNFPGIYTDVAGFRDWISVTVARNGGSNPVRRSGVVSKLLVLLSTLIFWAAIVTR